MNAALLATLSILGLGAAVVRRPAAAAVLVSGQTLLVGVGALAVAPGRSAEFLVAALLLTLRAVLVTTITLAAVSRIRESTPHDVILGPSARLCGALGLALALVALVPSFGLDSAAAEHTAVALVGIALALVLLRRAAVFAALAFLVADNGIAVAAVAAPGAVPLVIELGVAFDLVLLIAVAAVFQGRILRAFGTTDTQVLRGVRD